MNFDPGIPTCGLCGRPVERVTSYQDVLNRKRVVVAHCHGDTESVDLLDEELEALPGGFRFGVAFSQVKQLRGYR